MVFLYRRGCRLSLVRRIDHAARAIELLTDIALFVERTNAGRQWWNFVRIQRTDETGSDEDHQLGLLRTFGLALKQVADNRKLAQDRNCRRVVLPSVVEQAGDRERLTVSQLDVGFGSTRRERRNAEALEGNAIRKVERADLGTYL